jgi:hypothetical protein
MLLVLLHFMLALSACYAPRGSASSVLLLAYGIASVIWEALLVLLATVAPVLHVHFMLQVLERHWA